MQRQLRVQNVREMSERKPDIEHLRSTQEQDNFGVWAKYLMKQQDKMKKQKANDKKSK
jgi:hypothetical protein